MCVALKTPPGSAAARRATISPTPSADFSKLSTGVAVGVRRIWLLSPLPATNNNDWGLGEVGDYPPTLGISLCLSGGRGQPIPRGAIALWDMPNR